MKKHQKNLLKNFNFNIKEEMAIYTYLCKKKLTHRQKKILSTSTKFEGYHSWKNYIISKFKVYSKTSLIELSKYLNLLLRDANKFNAFSQGFWMAFMSSFLTLTINELINHLQQDQNPVITFFTIILFVPVLVLLLVYVYDNYSSDEQSINFFQDVKEIIDEMIINSP